MSKTQNAACVNPDGDFCADDQAGRSAVWDELKVDKIIQKL